MKKNILTKVFVATILSTCMHVLPVDAAPENGVYQQLNRDGRLKSTVTILSNPGTCDFMAMRGLGDQAYICMDALDKNGIIIEEYAAKYDPEIEPAYGFTINEANLRKCEQADWFNVKANKKNAKFHFSNDKLIVSGAGELYDGEYYFSPRSTPQANHALLAYAYEVTRKPNIPYDGQNIAESYNIFNYVKLPWISDMKIKNANGKVDTVILDNAFNIVMKYNNTGNSTYKPFFMSDKYVEWSENWLTGLGRAVNDDIGALHVHKYIAKNYPALTQGNNIELRAMDFFGGEGENAVYTKIYNIERSVDGDIYLSGKAEHCDNGQVRVIQYIGNKTITGDEVRLRLRPNTNCEVLGYVNRGDVVKVLGLTTDREWAAIKLSDGRFAYVSTQFVANLFDF